MAEGDGDGRGYVRSPSISASYSASIELELDKVLTPRIGIEMGPTSDADGTMRGLPPPGMAEGDGDGRGYVRAPSISASYSASIELELDKVLTPRIGIEMGLTSDADGTMRGLP